VVDGHARFDFHFKTDGTVEAEQFFLFPLLNEGWLSESADFPKDIKPFLLAPMEYTFYGNKVLIWVNLEDEQKPGSLSRAEREYCYEFDYAIADSKLVISNPNALWYKHPWLRLAGYGEPDYEKYHETLRMPFALSN